VTGWLGRGSPNTVLYYFSPLTFRSFFSFLPLSLLFLAFFYSSSSFIPPHLPFFADIPDVSIHPNTIQSNFAGKAAKNTGFRCQSILCAPVIDRKTGSVVAVVEFLNKKSEKGQPERHFDANDEKLAKMLGHHIGVFMEKISEGE